LYPGNTYWERSLLGYSRGLYADTIPIVSPSQNNGVAIFDSDYLDNYDVVSSFPFGPAPTRHRGELISPRFITMARDSSQNLRISTEENSLNTVPSIGIHLALQWL
jgi:hypothetical protein